MWTSKGRSGYGDSTIGGDYDSWDGISPNGRQYRNEATMETRDLSGADYWHLRKQNRPTEEIPASLHMLNKYRANIDAYAVLDAPVNKPVKKASLRDQISLADRHYNRMEAMSLQLDKERSNGMSDEEYYELRVKMDVRLKKAWARLCKENGWDDQDDAQHSPIHSSPIHPEKPVQIAVNRVNTACNSGLKDAMILITGAASLLALVKFFF